MSYDISKLDIFPTQPGVYLMKNQNGTVLYVGKAKNLKQRVKQYFFPGRDSRAIIPLLVANVAEVDTIIVSSEKEALLLESNLIKKYQPKYNALLKDDKSYVALKVNNKHMWPTVRLVRYKGRPEADGLYFGPYTSAYSAKNMLDMLTRLFPLRQCSDQEFVRRTRPCILYDMKRCVAPCVGKCTKQEYDGYVDRTIRFLRGQDKEILQELYKEMEQLSDALEFEKASIMLKTIRQIEGTLEGQNVDKPLGVDSDALAIFRQGEEVTLTQLFIRSGKLTGSRHYNFANIAEDDDELITTFLLQHYSKADQLPHEILIPVEISSAADIAEIISTGKRRKVIIAAPQRGDKRALVDMAFANAEATFKKEKDVEAIREQTLFDMQDKFRLVRYPERMECFDNSHLAGEEPVSSMVAFTDGVPDRKRYRKYKLRTIVSPDDYSAMYEVLYRRYKRAKEENDLPDLLIVDGGKGHLTIALKVLAELNIINMDVIAVAKEEGRHDKGSTLEQVFLPNVKDPIMLKRNSPILFMLQQIRDEAHRVAITFQKLRRGKKLINSSVSTIPGIGPTKTKLLLRHFGSLRKLKTATREDLEAVKGISKTNIIAILEFIKTNPT